MNELDLRNVHIEHFIIEEKDDYAKWGRNLCIFFIIDMEEFKDDMSVDVIFGITVHDDIYN